MIENRKRIVALTVLTLIAIAVAGWFLANYRPHLEPIKVGILHSETGTMAISERSVRDATLMAIDELNANGGILGRQILPIVVDGKSDPQTFAAEAERLITEEHVSAIFGCWTSASRKTVRPILERHDHLMFYPVQYEGLEQSPNIVYTGAAPNQQIVPAVNWCFEELQAQKFFLVGSDYVFPRTANAIIGAQVTALGGEIVGEKYVLLGSDQVDGIVQEIVAAQPDVILNTINGDTNTSFFAALRRSGITPDKIPTMSFSIAEHELSEMDIDDMSGDYAAWNYFQSNDREENLEFVHRFKTKFGAACVTDDPMEAGYFGVYLWAQAVRDSGTDEVSAVRRELPNQSFPAPEGIVSIDSVNHHTWKTACIGRIMNDGQFEIVWSSGRPLRPVPYPIYRTKKEWDQFLAELYEGWGERWAKPGN